MKSLWLILLCCVCVLSMGFTVAHRGGTNTFQMQVIDDKLAVMDTRTSEIRIVDVSSHRIVPFDADSRKLKRQ
jgi:hypothetical protein